MFFLRSIRRPFASLGLLAIISDAVLAATYSRTSSLTGNGFLDAFTWQAIADPTHGRVYVTIPC